LSPTRRPAWLLIVGCALLCAFFGIAVVCHTQGGSDLCRFAADGPDSSPDDTPCALLLTDGPPVGAGLVTRNTSSGLELAEEGGAGPALLAAVPGGLCLLI
jgi:hypothetical protein